jgi:hypothetical protein
MYVGKCIFVHLFWNFWLFIDKNYIADPERYVREGDEDLTVSQSGI